MYCIFPLSSAFVFHPSPHLHPLLPNSLCGYCLLFIVSAMLNNILFYQQPWYWLILPRILWQQIFWTIMNNVCWVKFISVLRHWRRNHLDGLMQERHNSSANALELHFSCSNPSICKLLVNAVIAEGPSQSGSRISADEMMNTQVSYICMGLAYEHFEAETKWLPFSRHFEMDFLEWKCIKISFTFVSRAPVNNIQALVQIMAWRWPGDKPSFEPMMVNLLAHICITWLQWVNNVHFAETKCVFCTLFLGMFVSDVYDALNVFV